MSTKFSYSLILTIILIVCNSAPFCFAGSGGSKPAKDKKDTRYESKALGHDATSAPATYEVAIKKVKALRYKWEAVLDHFQTRGISHVLVADIRGTLCQMKDRESFRVPDEDVYTSLQEMIFSEIVEIKKNKKNFILIYNSSKPYVKLASIVSMKTPVEAYFGDVKGFSSLEFHFQQRIKAYARQTAIDMSAQLEETSVFKEDYFRIRGVNRYAESIIPQPHILVASNGQHIQFCEEFGSLEARVDQYHQTHENWCAEDMQHMYKFHQEWEDAYKLQPVPRIIGGHTILKKRHSQQPPGHSGSVVKCPRKITPANMPEDSLCFCDIKHSGTEDIHVVNLSMNKGVALRWIMLQLKKYNIISAEKVSISVLGDGYVDLPMIRPDMGGSAFQKMEALTQKQQEKLSERLQTLGLEHEAAPDIVSAGWDGSYLAFNNSCSGHPDCSHPKIHVAPEQGLLPMLEMMLDSLVEKYSVSLKSAEATIESQ